MTPDEAFRCITRSVHTKPCCAGCRFPRFAHFTYSHHDPEDRYVAIVVGVAKWWPEYRLVEMYYDGASKEEPFNGIVAGKLNAWLVDERLPSQEPGETLRPWEDAWWDHVRRLLIHGTRLEETCVFDRDNALAIIREQRLAGDAEPRQDAERARRSAIASMRLAHDAGPGFVFKKRWE